MINSACDIQLQEPLKSSVISVLDAYVEPLLGQGLYSAGIVRSLALDGRRLQLGLVYPYPCRTGYKDTVMTLTRQLVALEAIDEVECEIDLQVTANAGHGNLMSIPNVKNVIAVASGKGGVGKSSTAVNLALALAAEGASTGILDADIYGPSVPWMLGIPEFKPVSPDGKLMTPAFVHGVSAQSIGFLLDDDQAAVWRGPMAAGALVQLVNETQWPPLDYLVVDMPPGTGDIQLTLSQKVPVSGAVVVTTPQDIALLDAKKGITMFQKVNIPVLGIVENMSFYQCANCGHKEYPFGSQGGSRIAERYGVPLLGALPLDIAIRQGLDAGKPSVVSDASGDVAAIYRSIARHVAATLAKNKPQPSVSIYISDEE